MSAPNFRASCLARTYARFPRGDNAHVIHSPAGFVKRQ